MKAILNAIGARLTANGRVEIRGFGSFSVQVRPSLLGRNPKTGERVSVPERHVPHFKPGVELRECVNIETRSRHITPADGNVFADLGSDPGVAAALRAESSKRIADRLLQRVAADNLHGETNQGTLVGKEAW